MSHLIPIIDLFAGPGGLSEGFCQFKRPDGRRAFRIALSVEKDPYAHKTLELRSFFRQFDCEQTPDEYYSYLRGETSKEDLFASYPREAALAKHEAWFAELGNEPQQTVRDRIIKALQGRAKWALIGGPPCQAYSLVGRSRLLGESAEKYEKDHRHFLYREYLRILADHSPPVFVFENVKGLLSSYVRGANTFEQLIKDLKTPRQALADRGKHTPALNYCLFPLTSPPTLGLPDTSQDPNDFVVRCEDHGIPQARHRVLILGVRSDLAARHTPRPLEPAKKAITLSHVLYDVVPIRSDVSNNNQGGADWLEWIRGCTTSEWLFDTSIDPKLRRAIKDTARSLTNGLPVGGRFVRRGRKRAFFEEDWFIDSRLDGFCNHESRSHMATDLHRYFYAAVFVTVHGRTPKLKDFPSALLPAHKNVKADVGETIFADRFRVQLPNRPATTITSHISKDGHYFIHWDPTQCRSLTVREAARCQTFPDNYFFEGPRTEQYKQVGNAVPPLLARQLAGIVSDLLE